MPSKTAEPLLTIAQAAEILGTSRNGVEWLIDQGKLHAYTLPPMLGRKGAKRFIPSSQVERVRLDREAIKKEEHRG